MPLLWPTLLVLLLVLREQSGRRERAQALASGDLETLLEPYPSGLFRWHAGAGDDPQVRAQKTPASRGEVLGAVAQGWRNATGKEPTGLGVLMLAAQADLETGSFELLYNDNLGNLTHVTGDGHPWVRRPEVTAPLRFRAYDSLLSGAEDLVRWVQKRSLLGAAARGDLDAYVAGLKANCYLGCVGQGQSQAQSQATDATYAQYQADIVARARLFEGVEPVPPPSPGPPTWALCVGAALLLLGALWVLGPKVPAAVELGKKARGKVKGFAYRLVGRQPSLGAEKVDVVAIDGKSGAATVVAMDVTPEAGLVAAVLADPKAVLAAAELPAPAPPLALPEHASPSCGCEAS